MKLVTALPRGIVAGAAFLAATGGPAIAQGVDCSALAAQISSLRNSSGSARMAAAAQKQAGELARTQAYARSIGCDRPQFLFFGDRPPQCDGINSRIQRMQANYAQLAAGATGDSGLRAQLQARYDSWCYGGRREPNFLDRLFGGAEQPRTYPPMTPDAPEDAEQQDAETSLRGGPLAVCVRTCDGGFFPISYSAQQSDLGPLQQLCTALCPNTEAKLYTRSSSRDMKAAVSADGEAYTDLPNAFKYEKTADPTCTCKPPNKTWAEALVDAEALLETRKGDIIVTPAKAEELSRPKAAGAATPPAGAKSRKFDPGEMRRVLEQNRAADIETAVEGALAAQAPTAGSESSGINPARDSTATVLRNSGEVRDTPTADGKRRKLRVFAPQ